MRHICAGLVATALLLLAGPAAAPALAAPDRIVITGGAAVAAGETVHDVVVIDGPVRVAGRVTGGVVALSGTVTISGSVDGRVTAVSSRARLLPGARVGGDLVYGDEPPEIAPAARVEGEVSDEGWSDFWAGPGPWIARFLFWLTVSLSTLVLGLAWLALGPRAAPAVWTIASARTGAAAALAAGLFIGLPALAVIALATGVGFPLGIGLILALLPLAAVGYVATCWLVGRRVRGEGAGRVPAFLVGWAIMRVIALVPFLGGLAWVAGSAFGLAALTLAAWYAGDPRRSAPAAPA